MSALKIGVSPAYFNKKCDEFAKLFDEKLIKQNDQDERKCSGSQTPRAKRVSCHPPQLQLPTLYLGHSLSLCLQAAILRSSTLIQATTASAGVPNLQQRALQSPELGAGWKIPFDNFDIYQRVRGMSEDNQNKDLHWINHLKVTNRVSGNHLPDDRPICEFVADVDNNKMLPTIPEHLAQRNGYITLIERALVEEIPYLAFCKDAVVSHIPNRHQREMALKSEKVRCQLNS